MLVSLVEPKTSLAVTLRDNQFAHYSSPTHHRESVDANVTPDYWAVKSDTEVHAWRSTDGFGLLTALNHRTNKITESICFDTEVLGLTPGERAFIWRLEIADPNEVDFDRVTMTSPIRRLARQKLLQVVDQLPDRMSIDLELSPENPVCLMVTHLPLAITRVDAKPCQYWLPSAYQVKCDSATREQEGQLTLMIKNGHHEANLLIPLGPGMTEGVRVTRRQWDAGVYNGVAPKL